MGSIVKYLVAVALAALAFMAGIGSAASSHPRAVSVFASPRVCFPADHWGPVADRYRPCVRITDVEEDGSFGYAVSDADGTVRYTSGVGALDR